MSEAWILKIILWLSIFWLPLFERVPLRNEANFKKNICVGVTFPFEAQQNPTLLAIVEQYKKQINVVTWILMLLVIPGILISGNMTIIMTVWGSWLLLCIGLMELPYILTNRKLKKWKKENGWTRENESVMVNTNSIPESKWISPWVFIALSVVPLLPLIYEISLYPLYLTMTLSNLGIWLCYRYAYRNKAEMVDSNVELTIALNQIRKRQWGKVFLATAIGLAIMSLLGSVTMFNGLFAWGCIGITIAICIVAYKAEMQTRRAQEQLTKESGKEWFVDEDDHWIWGLFYYNPQDSHLVINKRVGIGSTINFAKTSGKILAALVLALLLWIPFMGITIDVAISSDITIVNTEDVIEAQSGKTTYTIPREEIAEIQMLTELPSGLRKTVGTNTDSILKGDFTATGYGAMKVCVNQDHGSFMLITTTSGKLYLFNAD